MNSFVSCLIGQSIESRDRSPLKGPPHDVSFCSFARILHVFRGRSPKEISDEFQLHDWCLSLKQDPSAQEFGKNASHRPNINRRGVMFGSHQKLRCPVILSDYFLSHASRSRLFNSSQTKITDFEQTITIDQQISWLDVSMKNSGRMKILQSPKDLIQEYFYMIGGQRLR